MQIIKNIILTSFVLSLFFIQTISAVEYDYLGGRPANPDPDIPNSQSWFIYSLDKGESIEDSMVVINNESNEVTVLIYAADGIKSSNGGFALKQFVDPRVEVGSWVKFYPYEVPSMFRSEFNNAGNILDFCTLNLLNKFNESELLEFNDWCEGEEVVEITLPAKSQQELSFIFSVPQDIDVGEHTGGILIQEKEIDTVDIGSLQGVALTTRVGIRIYETVPGDIVKEIQIDSFNIVKMYNDLDILRLINGQKPDTHNIETQIKNIGNVSIDFTETITINDKLGLSSPIVITDRTFQVLRDDSFTSIYEWVNPKFGFFSVQSRIQYTDDDGDNKTLSTQESTLLILPISEAIYLILIIFVIFIIFKFRKIKQDRIYSSKGWINYTVKKDDSLASIARKHHTTWKVLATVNKIKPPYELVDGQRILVPSNKNNLSFRKI